MKTGVELITDERARQVTVEGFTAEHDSAHSSRQLVLAAACYTLPEFYRDYQHCPISTNRPIFCPRLWPWDPCWWKPSPENHIRDLVKAGALIAAEIDRLQRKEQSVQHST